MRQAMMFSKRGTSSAEVTAAIDASIGGDQFAFIETLPSWGANTTATLTANSAYLGLVRVAKPITVSQMTYGVGVAAGTVDLGIYTLDGANFARQASTGPTSATGSNTTQTIALTAPIT